MPSPNKLRTRTQTRLVLQISGNGVYQRLPEAGVLSLVLFLGKFVRQFTGQLVYVGCLTE
jgi:hypothetical protein